MGFEACHPAVTFLFFAIVITCSMCLMHPVCLLFSLVGAVWYTARLRGTKALIGYLRWIIPMMVMAALVNPAFVHQGVTLLAYLPSGNPLTLESILYGLAAGCMLGAVELWFSCLSAVMTSDKFIYIFGRVIPALSLVLSMTLRFVPRFKRQFRAVAQAQRYMGRDTANGSLRQRTRNALKVFSIMVTWSLESAIDTADSMRSRGYGTGKRSSFMIYTMTSLDWGLLAAFSVLLGLVVFVGDKTATFTPELSIARIGGWNSLGLAAYGVFLLLPTVLHIKEAIQWHISRSRI